MEVPASAAEVELVNQTLAPHNMVIAVEPDGEPLATSPIVPPEKNGTFDFSELSPGTYSIWCSIEDHAELGMTGTLVIQP